MTTFFIGDTHFGHENILKFEAEHRPFNTVVEMNEAIVERWNKVVNPKDTVWHLGDVVFGMDNLKYLGRLNGNKKLIMGNHDGLNMTEYLKYFNRVFGCAKVYYGHGKVRAILSHIPVHPQQMESRFHLNIHGHLHSKSLNDNRYFNVSCERNNLTPISLHEIMERIA